MDIPDSNIIVVGMGRSGISAARFLKNRGAAVTLTDSRDEAALRDISSEIEASGIKTALGGHSASLLDNAGMIVLSPGVPLSIPFLKTARDRGIPVIGEIELASRFIRTPMVAITGTNGKTTVTALIGQMLTASGFSVFVGGNIGTPLIDYVAGEPSADRLVVEVSSFQLDTIREFHPHVAVLLNITDDHLDRYDGIDDYAHSKARIFKNQSRSDIAVYNAGDARCCAAVRTTNSRCRGFGRASGIGDGAVISDDYLMIRSGKSDDITISMTECRMTGNHNRENYAAAALAALGAGGTVAGIQTAIREFRGLPHRLERVAEINGVWYVNDTKATNLDAVRRAVAAFSHPVILIMGGRGKGYDFSTLADDLKSRVKAIIALGETAQQIAADLRSVVDGGVKIVPSMEAAVNLAERSAIPGDVVLLSPACASFDMFDSYAHRGDIFRKAVAAITTGSSFT